jgi:PEP-CTERM/exosortase A-associated glycosyltransferase
MSFGRRVPDDLPPLIMRILHVLDHSVPLHSGYAFRTLAILREQRAMGWETEHVTSAKHNVGVAPVEEVDGLRFYRAGAIAQSLPGLNQLGVIHGLSRRLAQLVPELKPDVIHAHSPSLIGLAALRAARRFAIPIVYEVRAIWEDGAVDHGTATANGWRYRASRALETWLLHRVDAITTICNGLRQEILARGVPANKVTVIPNAVDPVRFPLKRDPDPALIRHLGLDGTYVVGFIGSFYGYEGLSVLLRAMPSLLERLPAIRLLLVGGGYEDERLRSQAREAGIGDKVLFTGRVPHDRVQEYYNLVDVFVYPRKRTRITDLVTPLKPLEAMAQGGIVVASDVGGHRELIRDGDTGLIFRAEDPRSLADAVVRVFEDPQLAEAIRLRARRFVEAERTWTASVARYADVYGRLVNAKSYAVASLDRTTVQVKHK